MNGIHINLTQCTLKKIGCKKWLVWFYTCTSSSWLGVLLIVCVVLNWWDLPQFFFIFRKVFFVLFCFLVFSSGMDYNSGSLSMFLPQLCFRKTNNQVDQIIFFLYLFQKWMIMLLWISMWKGNPTHTYKISINCLCFLFWKMGKKITVSLRV